MGTHCTRICHMFFVVHIIVHLLPYVVLPLLFHSQKTQNQKFFKFCCPNFLGSPQVKPVFPCFFCNWNGGSLALRESCLLPARRKVTRSKHHWDHIFLFKIKRRLSLYDEGGMFPGYRVNRIFLPWTLSVLSFLPNFSPHHGCAILLWHLET